MDRAGRDDDVRTLDERAVPGLDQRADILPVRVLARARRDVVAGLAQHFRVGPELSTVRVLDQRPLAPVARIPVAGLNRMLLLAPGHASSMNQGARSRQRSRRPYRPVRASSRPDSTAAANVS